MTDIDISTCQCIEGLSGLKPWEENAENIYDIDCFPWNNGNKCPECRPSRDKSNIIAECTESISHAAPGDRKHGAQFTVTESYRYHKHQCHHIAARGRQRTAASRHPVVNRDCPADPDDRPESDAEKVNRSNTLFSLHPSFPPFPAVLCRRTSLPADSLPETAGLLPSV